MDTTKLKDKLDSKVQSLQEPIAPAVVPAESGYIALSNNALDIIRENMKNQPLSLQLFDVVKSHPAEPRCFLCPASPGKRRKRS